MTPKQIAYKAYVLGYKDGFSTICSRELPERGWFHERPTPEEAMWYLKGFDTHALDNIVMPDELRNQE